MDQQELIAVTSVKMTTSALHQALCDARIHGHFGCLFWAPQDIFTYHRITPQSPVILRIRGFFLALVNTLTYTKSHGYPILVTSKLHRRYIKAMASIDKRGSSWFAQVAKKGVRKSASFPTKAQAVNWAATLEAEIIAGSQGEVPPNKTFKDLLQKYHDEVSPTKSGRRWEQIRLKLFMRDPIADAKLVDLNATHFTAWRDRRLSKVGPGSVLREWNIMSNACKRAVDEWRWLKGSPLRLVAKPPKPPARVRRPTDDETERLKISTGYRPEVLLKSATSRVGAAYLFAMETALRAGEVAALRPSEVFLDDGYLKVTGIEKGARKNNAAVRDVPMTDEAIRIVRQLLQTTGGSEFVFDVSISNLDALFRKARDRAGIVDLTFHDTRHEAITRLARKYAVLDLARIVGHTNIKELMTYYNPTIAEMVKRLRS